MDNKDGGWKSRKMIMAYVAMALGSIGYAGTAFWPDLKACYSEFCMFLLGASTIHSGGNTLVKWIAAKTSKTEKPKDQ